MAKHHRKEDAKAKEKTHHHEHHPKHHKRSKQTTVWFYTTVLFIIVSGFLGVMLVQGVDIPSTGMPAAKDINVVAAETIEYINNNLLAEGSTASLKNATVENGLYKIELDIGGNAFESYVSTDGVLLFPSAIDISEEIVQPEPSEPSTPATPDTPKSDRPVANVFIMSYCPFGLQMAKAVVPVMELLGDKADINIDYVNYIMHGEKEIIQNNYLHCIEEDQPDKFVAYLKCFVQSDDHEGCMTEAGVDQANLDACVARIDAEYNITGLYNDQSTWSGGRYPLYMVDNELAVQYNVRGSPTVVINGKNMQVSRSPEGVKQAICGAFNTPPEECEQTLSTDQEAPGIGALGSGGSTGAGSCG